MIINYIAFLCALVLSSVAGWYSIIGLTAIFSGTFWPIIIMGSILEVSKIVTASWLYRNWSTTPLLLKTYLTSAVVVLMFITSMGIFGFLSKAHIDQQVQLDTGVQAQVEIIDTQIKSKELDLSDVQKQIEQIDSAVQKLTESGQAKTSLREAERQKKARDQLVVKRDAIVNETNTLKTEKIKLSNEVKKLEAEVGPLKYIADLIYTNADTNQLEKAVRWLIILLVLVFDPLAVLLLIAANIGLTAKQKSTNIQVDSSLISIDPNSIVKM